MLTFNPDKHEYRLDGELIPGVTMITDQLSSYAGVPDDVMRHAADRGHAVHLATELDDADDLDYASLPEEIRGYVDGWRKLRTDAGWSTRDSEVRVYHDAYRYAGTLDCVGYFSELVHVKPTDLCLLDKKATYKTMPSAGPQVAAYAKAWDRQHPDDKIKYAFVARLKPDGTYVLDKVDIAYNWSVFLCQLTIRNWKKRYQLKQLDEIFKRRRS